MTEVLKTIGISVAVVIVAFFINGALSSSDNIGGVYNITEQTFSEGLVAGDFVQGGDVLSINQTGASRTLTASEFKNNSLVEIAQNDDSAALTLTLPTATQFKSFLKNDGDFKTIFVENNQSAAATTTTIAAGTNVDLLENDGQNVVIGINNTAEVTCWRKSDDTVGCKVNEMIPAD